MTMPVSENIFSSAGWDLLWSTTYIPNFQSSWQCKMQKIGWFGVVRGHPRSRAMLIARIRLPVEH